MRLFEVLSCGESNEIRTHVAKEMIVWNCVLVTMMVGRILAGPFYADTSDAHPSILELPRLAAFPATCVLLAPHAPTVLALPPAFTCEKDPAFFSGGRVRRLAAFIYCDALCSYPTTVDGLPRDFLLFRDTCGITFVGLIRAT